MFEHVGRLGWSPRIEISASTKRPIPVCKLIRPIGDRVQQIIGKLATNRRAYLCDTLWQSPSDPVSP